MLQELLNKQAEFYYKVKSVASLRQTNKQDLILEQIHHCIEELIEIRRELPARKDWSAKKYDEPNWDAVKEEAVDALHFLFNIFILLELNANEIVRLYEDKDNINYERLSKLI